jgi:hypothetical protein
MRPQRGPNDRPTEPKQQPSSEQPVEQAPIIKQDPALDADADSPDPIEESADNGDN